MTGTKSSTRRSANILLEGLPYIHQFRDKTIVIKYGGNAMNSVELQRDFCRDIVLMKSVGLNPVVVHGGGPQISRAIEAAGLKSRFVNGLRVTDRQTMDIVEKVVTQSINPDLVSMVIEEGWDAFGLGANLGGTFIRAKKLNSDFIDPDSGMPVEYGFVGDVESIDVQLLQLESSDNAIPIVAPIGVDQDGLTYNINADTVAGSVAEAVGAEKLVVLTNTSGILDSQGALISNLTTSQLEGLIEDRTISDGMLPKVRCAKHALDHGVQSVQIVDGQLPHSALLEIFTDAGVGTLLVSDESLDQA
ncbi:MAG: acetylglutamate kinase [Acidiferrobacterales bacterium]|nr:acetylglutamate kinase [Acidiferrobacterales bacterium]